MTIMANEPISYLDMSSGKTDHVNTLNKCVCMSVVRIASNALLFWAKKKTIALILQYMPIYGKYLSCYEPDTIYPIFNCSFVKHV